MGERRELNPRMVDSQSTALIHLATSAPLQLVYSIVFFYLFKYFKYKLQRFLFLSVIILFFYLISEIQYIENSNLYLLFLP